MVAAEDDIPILFDEVGEQTSGLLTTDDLDKADVEVGETSFNTCTRSGQERRQAGDRRGSPRAEHIDRRSGRDRRMFSYF